MECAPQVDLDVFSFSSEKELPEQVASIRSFLTHVGVPTRFAVLSEGDHSVDSRDLLRSLHPRVDVIDWDRFARPDLPPVLRDYARMTWRGKKVAAVLSLPDGRPVLYADSDILFFPGASELRSLGDGDERGPLYLPDCQVGHTFLDDRMLRAGERGAEGVNSGFFFHTSSLDWRMPLDRLRRLPTRPRLFAGQTVVHLAMHDARARPLDRARFVMATDDKSIAEDPYVGADTVLRHYVTPVRHKLWIELSRSGTGW